MFLAVVMVRIIGNCHLNTGKKSEFTLYRSNIPLNIHIYLNIGFSNFTASKAKT